MKKIKIVTDSTADLTKEQVEAMGITIVPLNVLVDGETYVDGVDFTPTEYLEKLKNAAELPKSSQPATGAFAEVFTKLHEEGYDIICILISEHISGTYQSAKMAAEMTGANVAVHSSHSATCGEQIQILEAYRMIEDGHNLEEIIARLEAVRNEVKLYIGVDSVENLVKGGRLSKGKGLLTQLLNIKPIIVFKDGSMEPDHKVRSMNQVAKYFIEKLEQDLEGKEIKYLYAIHVGAEESAQAFAKELAERYSLESVPVVAGTAVLATHVGPGTMAICYFCE